MCDFNSADEGFLQSLRDMANKLRIDSINATNAAKSGHPTTCCSAAEIMSVLFFHTMKYSTKAPRDPASDRFVLSKGHAAPILYAAWARAGLFPVSELDNLRKLTSDLEGHPTPRLDFVDVATGSLGQGLGLAAGMAYTGKYFDKSDYRVYCLVGDGESTEGSVWEALAFSCFYKLDNLVAIFDINRLGQSDPAPLQHDIDAYYKRMVAFGLETYVVDGHDVAALCKALDDAKTVRDKPVCILAKTYKGKGCPGIEDLMNWHGKALGTKGEEAINSLKANMADPQLSGLNHQQVTATVPKVKLDNLKLSEPPNYMKGQKVAPRAAYGEALRKLGKANPCVVALDGDMKNSTHSEKFQAVCPDRFIECFIAEQNMVAVAIGCACRDRTVPFASTYSAFLTRAFDQLRMGAISHTNANFVGSHAGCSVGEDGPSQMGLEDLAMFRSIPGSTVFYPGDAVSTERAVELAANTHGLCFIRITRPDVPVLYDNAEEFRVGQAKVVRQSSSDAVTVVACGVTLAEAVNAADILHQRDGISIRIIDPFTLKPLDAGTILAAARATGGRIVTVEDSYEAGGVGETVAGALSEERNISIKRLAVREVPRSGKPAELIDKYGIGASAIVTAVKEILERSE